MADRDCRDVGSADRRRERRLRSRMTVAAELAAALHQSCDGEADYARPTGTESSGGLRPALLIEVVPGRSVQQATVGYVAAAVPLLDVPSLAHSSAEASMLAPDLSFLCGTWRW